MLGQAQRYKGYADYVKQGVDEALLEFYQRGNQTAIVGDQDFRSRVYDTLLPDLEAEQKVAIIQPDLTMEAIVAGVARYYRTAPDLLRAVIKGPQKGNEGRKMAMYLCQEMADV